MTYAEYLRDTYRNGMKEGEAIGEARGEEKVILAMLNSLPVEQVAAILQKSVAELQAIIDHASKS